MSINSNAITADAATNSQGATGTVVNAQTGVFEIKIPGLGVDADVTLNASADTRLSNGKYLSVDSLNQQTQDLLAGIWVVRDTNDAHATNFGGFLVGYQTPLANMQKTGTASFTGGAYGVVLAPGVSGFSDPYGSAEVFGTASLTANFTTGAVSGQLSQMQVQAATGVANNPWNTVNLSATLSGNTFGGTTSAAAGGSGPFALGIASGTVQGNFYGANGPIPNPGESEVGAVWTLSDGTKSVVGVLDGEHTGGSANFLEAPAAATFGTTPPTTVGAGLQTAASGGPTFSGNPGFPAVGTVFAGQQSAMTFGAVSQPDTTTNAAGVTETIVNPATQTVELKVPGAGIDTNIAIGGELQPFSGNLDPTASAVRLSATSYLRLDNLTPGGTNGVLNYVSMQQWTTIDEAQLEGPSSLGVLMIGYQTPKAVMPSTGTATYSLPGGVYGDLLRPGDMIGMPYFLHGDGSITANFATGGLSGSLTNMTVQIDSSHSPDAWNDVVLTGSISGSGFSGTTSSSAALIGGAPSSAQSATGTLTGGFYGPSADELGAVWTLYDGTNAAIGTFGAPKAGLPTTVSAFAAATPGTSAPSSPATGLELATGDEPHFPGANGVVFALTQSAVQIAPATSSAGVSIGPDTATNNGGATLTMTDVNGVRADGAELKIPGLGIDVSISPSAFTPTDVQNANGKWVGVSFPTISNYGVLGRWSVEATAGGSPTNVGYFIAGYQTPAGAMPTSGTATYALNQVVGEVFSPTYSTDTAQPYSIAKLTSGTGSLSANFAAGSITGSLTGFYSTADDGAYGTSYPWNDVRITASIAGGTFSGSTSANSAPSSGDKTFLLDPSATGKITGAFYGPNADSLAAVWTLSDGKKSAVGGIAGLPQAAPSDRRLKRDIVPLGHLANGLTLYRYRYLGDHRAFVGVMAQDLLADPRFAGAVHRLSNGFLMVDYARIGFAPQDVQGMREAGAEAMRLSRAAA